MTHAEALLLVCAALGMLGLVLVLCSCAPEGYQKDGRFHYGKEDEL